MTTLAIVPASGSITATRTVCRVSVADAPANDTAEYDPLIYPTSPEITYYIAFLVSGVEQGRSYVFAPNGGSHVFNNYIFPSAGSWTVNLNKVSDDSTEATLAVTVAAVS
jgi:hypothetical protein